MTITAITDKIHISDGELSRLADTFRIGTVHERRHLPDGLMNVNWRLDSAAGAFALKRVTDVPLERLRRNLGVLGMLGDHGLPVCAPILTGDGSAVAETSSGGYCLFPWAAGEHIPGATLTLGQASALGGHIGRLHVALSWAADGRMLPRTPDSLTLDVTSAERASQKAQRLSAAVEEQGSGDAFDLAAADALEARREMIAAHAELMPADGVSVGPYGWTHGDLQYRNLLWSGGELSAVLDWDRVAVRPYAEEVVRTAQVQFGGENGFDLERVSAFVAGYRSVAPLSTAALADAVHRLWWKRLTDFWQLEFHYDKGDHSCDELFTQDEALLHWWTARIGEVEAAFMSA
ncbi:phosphotransferase [Streptomyces sp. NBC_00162]|uniref:phosphotransferase n=1 Tax=Streptomyces sp. NBC_00162 TaxID=2903629 RepID=UPI00214C0C73|nr:phosphotransferase [Streptomyces sp. NBC_00162]UUU44321.1 phosphotransferase [Streptomyces sp. NBC_00162]